MSAETRSLLPDWHQRPVRWKVENRTIEQAMQNRLDSRASWPTFGFPLDENGWPILPPLEKVETKSHRRSSCLTEYRPDTTAYLQGFVFGPDFNYSTVSKL